MLMVDGHKNLFRTINKILPKEIKGGGTRILTAKKIKSQYC